MVDKNSNAYERWKASHSRSYFENHYDTEMLFYDDSQGYKWHVDNISIKDFGEIHYLSWTEENNGHTKLFVFEINPHNHRRLEWSIAPAKGICLFWVNKWTEQGLYIIYNDSITNYALQLHISKKPKAIMLNVTELGEMLCIKSNWIIGFKSYTGKIVSLFDLRNFCYLNSIDFEEAMKLNIITSEQGENDEELD